MIAQLVKNPPAMQEILIQFLGWVDHWRRDRIPTPVLLGQNKCWSPITWPLWLGPYWKKGLCRCHQVKIRLLGWALISCDCCPHRKGRTLYEGREGREECRMKMEAETEMLQLQAKECKELPVNTQELGKGKEGFSLTGLRHLDFWLQVSRTMRWCISVALSLSVCDTLLWWP